MKRALFVLGMLLTFGLFCACSSDDEVYTEAESCISGTIILYEGEEEPDDCVFIGYLTMPERVKDKYNRIKTVVIPKDEFPLQDYQDGDIIDFNIVEVKSSYPEIQIGVFPPTAFLCSISLCK